jgi:hypothetical protein
MKNSNQTEASEYLFLSFQAEPHPPVFFRLSIQKLSLFAALFAFILTLSLTLSLFFFRELELNRKLEGKVLALETDNQLAQLQVGRASYVPQEIKPSTKSLASVPAKKEPVVSQPEPAAAPAVVAKPVVSEAAVSRPAQARVSDLTSECDEKYCEIKLSLMPTGSGTVEGELLMVLELEVPRIGGGNAATANRKQYILYPGFQSVDELSPNELQDFEKRTFKFGRGLQTNASFEVNKLLRPIAIHVYLFDTEGTLIQHERRTVEREEPSDS